MSFLEKLLKKIQGRDAPPQYADVGTEDWEIVKGRNGAPFALLIAENGNAILTETTPGLVTIKDNRMEHYWLSTESPPTEGIAKGAFGLEIDTRIVYVFDGTSWDEF